MGHRLYVVNGRKYISDHIETTIFTLIILTFCGTIDVILIVPLYHTNLPLNFGVISFKNTLPPVPAQLIAATLIV